MRHNNWMIHTSLTMLTVWIMVNCGACATTPDQPAQQQNFPTTKIPTSRIDQDQDGYVDAQTLHMLHDSTNHTLVTFVAIAGAVTLVLLVCVLLCRRRVRSSEPPEPSEHVPHQEQNVELARAELAEDSDWLDSGQRFPTGKHR